MKNVQEASPYHSDRVSCFKLAKSIPAVKRRKNPAGILSLAIAPLVDYYEPMRRKGKTLSLSLLQMDTTPGDRKAHVAWALSTIREVARKRPGILILPEIWSGGFEYPAIRRAARQTLDIIRELRTISEDHESIIVGSLPESRSGKMYNTASVIDRGAVVGRYRKRRLFSPMGEHRHFSAGRRHGVFATSAGTIGVAICFDLRFPELFPKMREEGVWLLIVPAQWPRPRCAQWESLLIARAIEGQFFVAGCNRVGRTAGTRFCGRSLIVEPGGKVIGRGGGRREVVSGRVDPSHVTDLRKRLPMR